VKTRLALVTALLVLAPGASAQSFNVDFSNNGISPPPTFSAAGQAGVWNATEPSIGGPGTPLVDTAGSATGVSMAFLFPTGLANLMDPLVTGNPATLLLDGYSASDVVQAVQVQGLAPGMYDVIVYGFVPGTPGTSTFFLFPPGLPGIGGAYTGGFVEGTTHGVTTTSVATDGILRMDWVSGLFGSIGFFSGFQIQPHNLGTNYCSVTPNSTGSAAAITASGSLSIAAANLELFAGPVPNEPFIFYAGPLQISTPFGDGFRCVGGSVVRIWPPTVASGNSAMRSVDPGALGLTPGTWNFQCWFRDPAALGAGFNLSDGLEVVLAP